MPATRIPQFFCHFSLFPFFLISFLISTSLFSAQDVTDDKKKLFIDEQLRLADGLSRRGHYQLAIEEYRKIIDKFPDDPLIADALSQMADAYSASGDLPQAISNYQLFFKKFSDLKTATAVKVNYAVALFKTGNETNRKSAFSSLEEIKASGDTAAPVKHAASYNLGKFHAELGNSIKAKNEFTGLASVKPSSKTDIYPSYARLELASILDKENEGGEAMKLVRSLIDGQETPTEIMCAALNYLAGVKSRKGHHLEAAETYEQILLQFPDTALGREAFFRKFESLFLAKEYTRLTREIDMEIGRSADIDAQSEKLYFIKASTQMEQGLFPEARKTLSSIIVSPKSSPGYFSKSASMSVQCLINKSRLQDAVKEANDFFKNPKLSIDAKLEISNNLIRVLGTPHDKTLLLKEAINSARDVRERAILRLALASTYANLSQIDSSLSLYKDILGDCPEDLKPDCLFGIAKCHETSKNDKEALEFYRKLADDFPASKLQPEALLRIAVLTLYEKPDSEEPREILIKLEKEQSSNKDIHGNAVFYLSYIDFMKGGFSKAAEGFRRISNDNAYDPALVSLAREYLLWSIVSEKITPEAEILFADFASDGDRLSSLNPDLLLLTGNQFSEAGKSDAAAKCYEALVKNPDPDNKLRGLIAIGLLTEKKGDMNKTLKSFRDAEKIVTQNKDLQSELLSYLGMTLLNKGEKDEAVLVFEKCIEMSVSKTASARARLGLARILSDNKDDLVRANRYAMSVFILSDDPILSQQAMILSIDISIRQKKLDEARTTFGELKKRFPELLKDEKVKKLAEKLK
ncbi:MAG: hypothetical protein A2X48_10270 [Lentisphaerae bacterium GWF2_49_21]|nr:MAG: hypothetical protein A2X48_10270 [Lentisphaerae bacterium GWF2_49_21]